MCVISVKEEAVLVREIKIVSKIILNTSDVKVYVDDNGSLFIVCHV